MYTAAGLPNNLEVAAGIHQIGYRLQANTTLFYIKGLENPWNLVSTEVIDPGLGKNDSV